MQWSLEYRVTFVPTAGTSRFQLHMSVGMTWPSASRRMRSLGWTWNGWRHRWRAPIAAEISGSISISSPEKRSTETRPRSARQVISFQEGGDHHVQGQNRQAGVSRLLWASHRTGNPVRSRGAASIVSLCPLRQSQGRCSTHESACRVVIDDGSRG